MSEETSLYASITKDQLISMIHFLEKRGEESKKESDDLKALLKSLREEYRTGYRTEPETSENNRKAHSAGF